MIDHEDDIMARPARSWFQTPKQRKEASTAAKSAADGAAAGAQPRGKKADRNAAAKGDRREKGGKQERDRKVRKLVESSIIHVPASQRT